MSQSPDLKRFLFFTASEACRLVELQLNFSKSLTLQSVEGSTSERVEG